MCGIEDHAASAGERTLADGSAARNRSIDARGM
jgi:hypothetical protein